MIQLENITWSTGARVILDDLTLTIPSDTYAVLMGSTGCGKTTLLEVLCGLRQPQKGRVLIDKRDVTSLEPRERGIGYVPQDLALFPTLKVFDQIAFALNLRRLPADARVRELASELAISISSTANPKPSPAAKSNASPSPEPSLPIRNSFCSTNRSPPSTKPCAVRPPPCSNASSSSTTSPFCMSPTLKPRPLNSPICD